MSHSRLEGAIKETRDLENTLLTFMCPNGCWVFFIEFQFKGIPWLFLVVRLPQTSKLSDKISLHLSICSYKTKLVLDPKILYLPPLKNILSSSDLESNVCDKQFFRRKRSITKKTLHPVSRQSLVSNVFIQKILSNPSKIWSARIKFFPSFVTNSWGKPGHYFC